MGFLSHDNKVDNCTIHHNSPSTIPCPGISEDDNSKVKTYLKRTAALGGGGSSLADISKRLFQRTFSKLQIDKNRKVVVDQQMHEWKW